MIKSLEGNKCLVTGGAGFIGSHLVDRLVRLKCQIIALDDLSNGNINFLNEALKTGQVKFIKGSVTNKKLIKHCIAVEKCHLIFHLASLNLLHSLKDPIKDLQVNTIGTLNILKEMQKNVDKSALIFSSTGSVYGEPKYEPQDEQHPFDPVSPYGVSKLAAEKYVILWSKLYHLRTTALRYYNVYGPRQNYGRRGGVVSIFIYRLLKGLPPIIEGTGTQKRSFTYVQDVVDANILAAVNQKAFGEVFNIASHQTTTINELAKLVLTIFHSKLKPLKGPRRIGDIDSFTPSISKAQKNLGYRSNVTLNEGLRKTVEWFKDFVCKNQKMSQ